MLARRVLSPEVSNGKYKRMELIIIGTFERIVRYFCGLAHNNFLAGIYHDKRKIP